jgi:rubredoxin
MAKIRVFENASRLGEKDLLCPKCGSVAKSPYRGKTGRLNIRCPSCNFELQEFRAIAVTHGDADEFDIRQLHRRLRDYWERQMHGEMKKQAFARAADEIGIYDYDEQ